MQFPDLPNGLGQWPWAGNGDGSGTFFSDIGQFAGQLSIDTPGLTGCYIVMVTADSGNSYAFVQKGTSGGSNTALTWNDLAVGTAGFSFSFGATTIIDPSTL